MEDLTRGLISRLDAKKALCNLPCYLDAETVQRCIEALDKVPPTQHWIPCSERLPEEKINPVTHDLQKVLCFCDFGGTPKVTDVRTYCYGTPIGHTEAHFWHGPQIMDYVVTHWMPFPEPPKEG